MIQNSTPKTTDREITEADVKNAAAAGVKVLNHESTAIPGSIRHDIAMLEAILKGIADGNLIVGTPVSK